RKNQDSTAGRRDGIDRRLGYAGFFPGGGAAWVAEPGYLPGFAGRDAALPIAGPDISAGREGATEPGATVAPIAIAAKPPASPREHTALLARHRHITVWGRWSLALHFADAVVGILAVGET